MEISIKKSFFKELENVPDYIAKQTDEIIDILKKSDSLFNSGLDYVEMKGKNKKGYYRIRVGDYRIGCSYEKPSVIVITILHRREIYKYFP